MWLKEFEKDPSIIYLNSGTLSKVPRQVLEALLNYEREYERNPTAALFDGWRRLWDVQQQLARFFGARAEDLFLRPNVTTVMNQFILGLPLKRGDEILVSDLEYGAIVNTCRFRAEKDGLALRSFPLPHSRAETAELGTDELASLIVGALAPTTKLLVLSHVITGTGLLLPLAAIARETRRRGVYLAIDGAHSPGAVPIDFSKLGDVDFFGGNLHKWMMGPKGTSFGWVPERHHELLTPILAGWTTYDVPPAFAPFAGGEFSFATRMLPSACYDFAPYFALKETIEFWDRLGADRIRARIRELQIYLESAVERRLGWRCMSPPLSGALRGPLTTFELPEPFQSQGYDFMHRLLWEHGLQLITPQVAGLNRIRITPHVYNTEAEIDRAVGILGSL